MRFTWRQRLTLAIAIAASATAAGQTPNCVVRHQAFVQGGVAQGQMRVVNDGSACDFTFKFAGQFEPSDWKIEDAPKHGRLEIGGSIVKYFPEANYAGADAFTVAVFGNNPMLGHGHRSRDGRFAFKVDVRARQ